MKKRIVLIGPVYPYKGGIAHYTGLLYRVLDKNDDVTMISYKFQYPKLLYKKEQKDYRNDGFKVDKANYWLHTANPFNWFKCAHAIKRLNPDIVIIQWWHPYFAPCYWTICRLLKDIKIMFICHNVFPHERFPLDRLLTKAVLRQGSCYIVQSKMDTKDLQSIIKEPVYRQTVHPTYNAFRIDNISMTEARRRLQIGEEKKVLLFFGFIREYKGLPYLIQAMPIIMKKVDNIELLIVGDFSGMEEKERYLDMINENGVKEIVKVYDGYIPDREVEKFFAASNLIVLPYISATQSGIAQIAFGFDKPVIATNVGGLPDVIDDGKTGYVVEAESPTALADAVILFFAQNKEEEFTQNVRKEAYRFSWDRMAEAIAELHKSICDRQ